MIKLLCAGLEAEKIEEIQRSLEQGRSDTLARSKHCLERGERIQQLFQDTLSVFKGWGTAGHFHTALLH